jgi:hypothetical protein
MQVYNVHESSLTFEITVGVNVSTAAPSSGQMSGHRSEVKLSPSRPTGRTPDKRVSAQLVGDLVPYNAFPVLTSQRLLMPTVMNMSQLRPADWMLVDPTMITMDGSECNKIGVGFSAFRFGHDLNDFTHQNMHGITCWSDCHLAFIFPSYLKEFRTSQAGGPSPKRGQMA